MKFYIVLAIVSFALMLLDVCLALKEQDITEAVAWLCAMFIAGCFWFLVYLIHTKRK